jgi:hypothetical protein
MAAFVAGTVLAFTQLAMADDPAATPAAVPASTDATATVVFFRPSKFMGAAVTFKVREGTTELGKLKSGTFFVAHVTPGIHEYTVHSEAKDVLTMEVEAGQTYYVQGTIGMGAFVGHPNLAPSDAATYEGMKSKLKDSAAAKN